MFAVCKRSLAAAVAAVAICAGSVAARAEEEAGLHFERDIQPILASHCLKCHGEREPQGGLNLSTAESLSKGGDNGSVIVNGIADESLLFQKVVENLMPPPEENDPLGEDEVSAIRRWLNAGAAGVPTPVVERGPAVTDQDREFWAFRPPIAAPVPDVAGRDSVRTPIDAFLLSRLESRGLAFSPNADRPTLLRRAYLDLIGLPPPPDAVEEFLADQRPDAYERLLDRLLESPQYGERWGRHWLDVAGYTDSPHWNADAAGNLLNNDDWLYRDYVVRSLNDDKPYDRFLTEQLAGDELVDWRNAVEYSPAILDPLIATGYLRTTPDWTHTDGIPEYRFDTLARVVDNVSTGLLGLTMGCARCHSHKFDPITHDDYYRLMAVFATAYNPEHWLPPVDRFLPDVPPDEKAEIDRHNAELEAQATQLRQRRDEIRVPRKNELVAAKLANLPEVLRADVAAAIETSAPMRTEVQRYLAAKFAAQLSVSDQELSSSMSDDERAAAAKLETDVASLLGSKRTFGRIQGLCDVGDPPALRLLIRGDARTPGKVVEAGYPAVLCLPGQSECVATPERLAGSSGRRLAFARWLTSRDHPLTARVIVNRVWRHHFGTGLVATPENFGRSGALPSNPQLLDWLAVDFMERGWRMKRLHKLLMTSTAYRQSAHRPLEVLALSLDPENELLWRMNLRRMEAEVLRDSILAVSGNVDPTIGGPPIPVEADADGLMIVPEQGLTVTSPWRRSLYLRSLRGSHPGGQGFKLTMLEIFDFPEIVINCTHRSNSTTPLQSLALLNGRFTMEQARGFADRIRDVSSGSAPAEQDIETAFVLALARRPRQDELTFCLEHLTSQSDVYANSGSTPDEAARQALTSLCLMLLASNEFLYIN